MPLGPKQCILGIWLLQNTTKKLHVESRTHWSLEVAKMALILKNLHQHFNNADMTELWLLLNMNRKLAAYHLP